jgi:hypothetical protein
MKSTINKNIILVGPGHLPIPVNGKNGWGGIENILTWIIDELKDRNQHYELLNDQNNFINKIKSIEASTPSLIHLHYDDYASAIKQNCASPLLATSHSPYHPFKEMWNGGVNFHFNTLFSSIDCYLGQSVRSNANALSVAPKIKLGLCRCGIPEKNFAPFRKSKGNKKSLILGKIESRKNQFYLQNNFANDLELDFVGQIADSKFIGSNIGKSRYLGTWSREEVIQNMTEYSSIILLSTFEGDVVIVKEALASGCSLIVSEKAALNLDGSHPFIKILSEMPSKQDFINLVELVNEENEKYREQIFLYFKKHFDISVTVDEYISSLNQYYA